MLKRKIGTMVLSIYLICIAFISLLPFIFMISSSFKQLGKVFEYPFKLIPDPFTWKNYTDLASSNYDFARWYQNTIVMVLLTVAFKLVIVSMTAYAFARLRFKGKNIIFMILLSSMMIPGDVTLIPRYVIYKFMNITDSMWALVLPYTFDIFFVFLLRQFFITIPQAITESALIEGCSHFKIFYKIVVPLSKPAMVTMVLFTFVWAWNDYISPYIFITNNKKQMLSVGIQLFQTSFITNYSMQMAATTLVLIPVIVVFLATQKYFVEGIVMSGVKG